jgi:hypothetical protein
MHATGYRSEKDMPDKVRKTIQDSEVHFIVEAADLFGAIIQALKSLESHDRRLAQAMALAGYGVQQRLSSLSEVIELLRFTRNPDHGSDLIARAKTLISRLSGELDELASLAEREYSSIPRLDDLPMSSITH